MRKKDFLKLVEKQLEIKYGHINMGDAEDNRKYIEMKMIQK